MADVLLLVDESGSDQNTHTQDWLATVVDDIHTTLTAANIDTRYGLVGFGESISETNHRFAHTQLIGPTGNKQSFTADVSQLQNAISNDLAQQGFSISEDGWDAVEHAIAEANFVSEAEHAAGAVFGFREGTVPMVVIVQADQGRTVLNKTLTHDGILAALKSKNVILNAVVAGELLSNGEPITGQVFEPITQTNLSWAPIFNLSPYGLSSDVYVLGVEADGADNFTDGQHNYHAFNTTTDSVPDSLPTTESDAIQVSFNGSNTGATGMVASGKSVLIDQSTSGGIGPTAAGYWAKSVAFAFEDLINRSTGNPVAGATRIDGAFENMLLSDQDLGSFQFSFFGTRNEVRVNNGGFVTFVDSPSYAFMANRDLSQVGGLSGQPLIAALWDNLRDADVSQFDPGPNSAIIWQVKDSGLADERLVIQWEKMRYGGDDGLLADGKIDPVTFEAVLYRDGRIRFNYLDIDSFPNNEVNDTTVTQTGGISATVGIWKGSADAITLPAGKFVPGPHTVLADPSGELVDSYVRMAWDTGGAAWDVGVVDRFGAASPEANALRDKFIASLGNQITRAALSGKVVHPEQALVAINYGGNALAATQGSFAEDTGDTANTRWTTSTTVNTSSNSVPLFGSPAAKAQEVFQSARTGDTSNGFQFDDVQLTFPTLATGKYVVELYFAEISTVVSSVGARVFDVLLEGRTVLNDYDIFADQARIVPFGASTTELDVAQLGGLSNPGGPGGVVKRFQVDVSSAGGAAGLQIVLLAQNGDALINGVRILTPVGDYTRDGNIDCYDYNLWRANFDSMTDLRADGNGNGVIDAADYVVWANAFNAIMHHPIGDFNRDGHTNMADYNLWKATFDSMSDLRADANCNGVVDAADYVIWRDTFSSMIGAARFGVLNAAFDPNTPPEVVGFMLSAGGVNSFGFFGMAGSGEQLRSVPLAGVNKLSITFNQAVIVAQSALALINLDGSAPSVVSFAYDDQAQTATWTFATSLADGRYLVRLADSVHSADNEALDGEFTNPWSLGQSSSSVLPSGDGTAGGEFRFRFTVLAGDTDHNNIHGTVNYQNWKSYEPGMILVSMASDENDANYNYGDVSAREALVIAAAQAGGDTIVFDPSISQILLSLGQLTIDSDVTIAGPGAGTLTIDAQGNSRVFGVNGGVTATLSGLTIKGGNAYDGGGIHTAGNLTLRSVHVEGNSATHWGGGICATGNLTLQQSSVHGNLARRRPAAACSFTLAS